MTQSTSTDQHLQSPLGDCREHAVNCHCGRATWNICANCAAHCSHVPATTGHRARVLVAAFLAVVAILGVGGLSHPQGAAAAVLPTVTPVRVVLAGPTATMTTTVVATAPTTAHGLGRWIAVSAPINGAQTRVGVMSSRTPAVTVRVALPSRTYTLGRSTWMARDFGDNRLTTLTVDARQASRFESTYVESVTPDLIAVGASLRHFKAATGAWVASQASPVQVQAYVLDRWVTVTTLVTDQHGQVAGTVTVPVMATAYRLTRPDGAQVWGTSTLPQPASYPGYDY